MTSRLPFCVAPLPLSGQVYYILICLLLSIHAAYPGVLCFRSFYIIKKLKKQIRENPGGIILDYRGSVIDLDKLVEVVEKRLQWRHDTSSIDIIIILDDGVQVWRY